MCYGAKKEVLAPQELGKMTRHGDILVTRILWEEPSFPGLNFAPQYEQQKGWNNCTALKKTCQDFSIKSNPLMF